MMLVSINSFFENRLITESKGIDLTHHLILDMLDGIGTSEHSSTTGAGQVSLIGFLVNLS